MKIGILSMQKILNYGSFLQAYSLKTQMEVRGHDVYFIDIEPGIQLGSGNKTEKKTTKLHYILERLFDKNFLKKIMHCFFFKKMSSIHINDYTVYLGTHKFIDENDTFDLVIIGSDEVFNCCASSPWGFSKQLFGQVPNAKKVVTYAASCGSTSYDAICKYDLQNELKDAMSNFKKISVRDLNTADFVEKILGIKPEMHLDPVFLTDFPEVQVSITSTPYMLIYAYTNRIYDEFEISAIKEYAKSRGLEILCVGMYQQWCKNCITANAFELLQYIKNAECIISDTFHGTVFSIKYNKNFGVLLRKSNYNKLYGLLEMFGLTDRILEDDYGKVLDNKIDFEYVNKEILQFKERANRYFDKILML